MPTPQMCWIYMIFVLASSTVIPAAGSEDDPADQTSRSHLGTWRIESATIGGERFAAENWAVRISEDQIEILGKPIGKQKRRTLLLKWDYEVLKEETNVENQHCAVAVQLPHVSERIRCLGALKVDQGQLRVSLNNYLGNIPEDFKAAPGRWVVHLAPYQLN